MSSRANLNTFVTAFTPVLRRPPTQGLKTLLLVN
jgi:hypothetical protein